MAAPIHLIDPEHPQPRTINHAVAVLQDEGLVVYPTDTSYGIGCDPESHRAIKRLRQVKPRDPKKPVTFLVRDLSMAARYAHIGDRAHRLMKRLTPGPYTFVLPATKLVPKVLHNKQRQVGIRIPDHSVPLALVARLGHPILNTSATDPLSGEPIGDPREIRKVFGHVVDLILDSGLNLFDSSTVLDLCGEAPVVLREGKGPVDVV
ncbi:MAG: threonylcarbamoyl-AMP synthase [Deltaproteobacteria bacterium]|nr:MAG: threonylcarbamoyl-AMP synthase [Deltaproteobacteria bacterium]